MSTLNQPVYQIARQMVQMLSAQIDGQPLDNPHQFIEPVLEIRESTTGRRKKLMRWISRLQTSEAWIMVAEEKDRATILGRFVSAKDRVTASPKNGST